MSDHQTPRVNASYVSNFTGQNVRIAGKVLQIHGNSATIDAQGTVAIHLDAGTHIKTVGNVVEVIGKVNGDQSIKELFSSDFGTNVELSAIEAVVQATHTYRELFYDAK
ncbi:hypothetical protein TWF569_006536 [Orbilia oligospora]|uniref:Replication factor A protein 3 n=1 Tax=Orbilia oligospora TaxID=2813651 RepID=A0A7C8NLE6_ORBOL|nr:hypothetical protein TWF102_002913 [Orbilia oligospora]KAF3103269.1 hypothetical protein TWF103_007262 [Orbilia oligospora]KAF3105682.1 hypothetical protein TWF706_003785 [Orbilia oligospora]KAF3118780.1 hypothetical protein TWF703_004303 [Orbilia oligospora]KAF3127529.1 hypothetical protein TWF594_000655 [Orbilia oligospora]